MIEKIYSTAYAIWNYFIGIAMTLFTTSPKVANGGIYATTYTLYRAIANIAVPIAIVFFLIAIFKDVLATPADQQIRKFASDALKFTVMIGILINLWTIMGYIMQIADGVTSSFASVTTGSYEFSPSSDLGVAITSLENIDGFWTRLTARAILLVGSFATFGVIIGASFSIVSCSFQRIIKPLVVLPFSSIAVAMGSGSNHDTNRIMVSYLKTFFGFCISGAFMVVCVKLGASLSDGLVAFDMNSLGDLERVIFISVQNAVTPLVIAGLVKGADSMIAKMF